MAELPKNIRKPGGDLVAARSPFTRRVLLPTEADLCNALGITEKEYFQFLEGVAAIVKERSKGYEHIPEIVNMPQAIFVGGAVSGGLTFFGQVALGVALTAASVLLAPKPPSQKQGTSQRTADIGGTKKFAPQFSFNSVQDLANLGDLIPLIFANRTENPNGGIRVNSQLLWSQMVSLGSYQQLKILALFSLGEIARKPDLKGYAIGDLLIENYHAEKIYKDTNGDIPFLTNGGIFTGADTNIFRIDDKRHFSGTRNPTTQATFGLSNPMPNATVYRLPYELVRTPSDVSSSSLRPSGRITFKKRRKLLGSWPMCAGFVNSGTALQQKGDQEATVGGSLIYQIVGTGRLGLYEGIGYQQDSNDPVLKMDPHGVEDINASTKTVREATDSYIAIGEQYMAGSTLVTCERILEDTVDVAGRPWDGTKTRNISFRVLEPGRYESVNNTTHGLGYHCQNPYWLDGKNGRRKGDFFSVKSGDWGTFYYEQEYDDSPETANLYAPSSRYTLQKVTLGTISNNRKCHITEIGIKSKVFKEIRFANVNSKPTEAQIYDIYDHKSTLSLGNINKYITRFSFFKLQVRKVGQDTWNWLKPEISKHTGLFCVRGNTPEFQYNYIRIDQPTLDQYEYRFFPWPGAAVVKEVQSDLNVKAMLLNSNGSRTPGSIDQFKCNINGENYDVNFAGNLNYVLNDRVLSNTEWNLGAPDKVKVGVSLNTVTGFETTQAGSRNDYDMTNLPKTQETYQIFTDKFYHPSNPSSGFIDGDNHTLIVGHKNHPGTGWTQYSLYINPADVTPNEAGRTGPAWGDSRAGKKAPGDDSLVEFHYITEGAGNNVPDGLGGKFIIGGTENGASPSSITPKGYTSDNNPMYGVTKAQNRTVTAPAVVNKEVSVKTNGNGSGLKARIVVYASNGEWFAKWNLTEIGQNYENNQTVYIDKNDLNVSGLNTNLEFKVNVQSGYTTTYSDEIESAELNPYDAASDFWQYEGDRSSHLDGPEHQITYCNEIIETEGDKKEGEPATYEKLAYAGLRINSSIEWTNFSQFSAYFKEGVKVKSLIDGTRKATNLFPEIAYALLTDKTLGAGAVISESSVDDANMTIAAKFCKANNLFWDGMIADRVNLREFIYQQALYCLLDFTIIGGKFSLYPAVPFDPNTFEIDLDGEHSKPKIKAMFTDGNISDLSVSFLSPEDRQAFKVNVIYRKEKENGFPEIKSAVIRLDGTEHEDDPLETFDLSGFCTSRAAAVLFAKYTLVLRKHLDHTVSFKTAPHYINGVRPGDYIRVFSTTQHVQRFNNGAILDDGTVVSKDTISGSKNFYYWNPSTIVAGEIMPVTEASVDFTNTNAVKAFAGSLFTIKESEASDQCYKVESITFGDEGLVELTGSYAELTSEGKLAMLQNWSSSSTLIFDEED